MYVSSTSRRARGGRGLSPAQFDQQRNSVVQGVVSYDGGNLVSRLSISEARDASRELWESSEVRVLDQIDVVTQVVPQGCLSDVLDIRGSQGQWSEKNTLKAQEYRLVKNRLAGVGLLVAEKVSVILLTRIRYVAFGFATLRR